MMNGKFNYSTMLDYIAGKLAAAGFVFLLFIGVSSGFDLYGWSEKARIPGLWGIFYAYAIIYSIIVDVITRKAAQRFRIPLSLLLLTVGGFVPFLIIFHRYIVIAVIAGIIGTLCAYVFYAISYYAKRKWPKSGVLAIVLLTLLLILANGDFTVKRGWIETRTENTFEASFTLFHGELKIPIEAAEGQTVTFSVEWHLGNSGGYGMTVVDRHGDYTGMIDLDGNRSGRTARNSFTASSAGTYFIVLSGDQLRGGITVAWSKAE